MWMQKGYFVYMMSSQRRVLYVGVTNNLPLRVWQHKIGAVEGFTSKYKVTQLVYYESFDDVHKSIHREKEIKGWVRQKKIELINSVNPKWRDLSAGWYKRQSDEKLRKLSIPRNDVGPTSTV